jgi:ADP-L-glycero-D-manno-heptose 6-epimerase
MIAITGAAGFIGSNLAHRLAGMGQELLLIDHPIGDSQPANWAGLGKYEFLDHAHFIEHLGAIVLEAVFHLGACSDTTESNWEYLKKNNIVYSQRLWEHCVREKIPYLYASSAATYGDGSKGFDDRTPAEVLHPLNFYGKSKNDFDAWALNQPRTKSKWAGFKFFNVYGPREIHKHRMASVVYQTWKQVKATGSMKLFRSNDPKFTDGGQLRDFVFVNDNIDHMLWFWKEGRENGVYNSGTGKARTFFDLAKAVFDALGLEPNITFIEMPKDLIGKYQNFTEANMTKLREEGYDKPPTSLEEGVRQTVHWLESEVRVQ